MTAPYVRDSQTSQAAAESISSACADMRSKILAFVRQRGGCTCDEIEGRLGLRHQTCSARVAELFQAGLLRDSGQRRTTRSRRKAVVWEAPEQGALPFEKTVRPKKSDLAALAIENNRLKRRVAYLENLVRRRHD